MCHITSCWPVPFMPHACTRARGSCSSSHSFQSKTLYLPLPPCPQPPPQDLNDVIAPSCYSCFDYPNALADIVVSHGCSYCKLHGSAR
jgi:hypothetical protein